MSRRCVKRMESAILLEVDIVSAVDGNVVWKTAMEAASLKFCARIKTTTLETPTECSLDLAAAS